MQSFVAPADIVTSLDDARTSPPDEDAVSAMQVLPLQVVFLRAP